MHGISAIIVTWNSQREIVACIHSLSLALSGIHHEVIVVDNHSGDDTCAIVSRHFPRVFLIRNKTNTGFGAGNNAGIARARYDHILLINPDTVANAYALRVLFEFLGENPRAGVVGPEQVNEKGRFLFTTSKLSIRGILAFVVEDMLWRLTGRRCVLFCPIVPVQRVNAGCIMCRRDILGNTHRWFDPALFLYGEEFNFFPRVQAAGWKIFFLRHIHIIHYRDRSINQSRGRLTYAWRSFTRVVGLS